MRRAQQWLGQNLAIALFIATAICVCAALAIGLALNASNPATVPFEAAKSLVAVATGLLLGGVLKFATDDHADTKRRRDEIERRFDALIADMHASHDRLEATRLLIAANRSAKTYGERMHDVIDAHVVLSKIARTPSISRFLSHKDDAGCLESMMAYLTALEREFRTNYEKVLSLQRYDDEVTRRRFSAAAIRTLTDDAAGEGEPPPASALAWAFLQSRTDFPVLEDLCSRGNEYETRFLESCRTLATRLLEEKVALWALAPNESAGPWPTDPELTRIVDDEAKGIVCRADRAPRSVASTTPAAHRSRHPA